MSIAKLKSAFWLHHKNILIGISLLGGLLLQFGATSVSLAAPVGPASPPIVAQTDLVNNDPINCPIGKELGPNQNGARCILDHIVGPVVLALSILSGVLVVISIIIAGIQYSTSGGDPSKVAAARKRIYSSLVALVAFVFLYAFIQWIVPGGVKNGGNV